MRLTAPLGSILAVSLVAQTPTIVSTQQGRKNLRITLYQTGNAFIQETRSFKLPQGQCLLVLEDLAPGIDHTTFQLRAQDQVSSATVLRQSFLNSRPTAQQVLARFVGKPVQIAAAKPTGEVLEQAVLLSYEGDTMVLQYPNRVEVLGASYVKRLVLPGLPTEIPPSRRIEVTMDSPLAGQQTFNLAYVSSEFQWQPSYSLVLQPGEDRLRLTAWGTIYNGSAATFENAQVDLLAGDVGAIPDGRDGGRLRRLARFDKQKVGQDAEDGYGGVTMGLMPGSANAGERKVYSLPEKLDLIPSQSIQVPFLEANNVKVRKEYRLTRNTALDEGEYADSEGSPVSVDAFLLFKNDESQHLGRQLPRGPVRLFQADKSGVLRFLGQDEILESASGTEVRLGLGTVADLTALCRLTDHKIVATSSQKNTTEEKAFEIRFTNRKEEQVTIHTLVDIEGEWSLLSSNLPGTKEQAHALGFQVQIPAKGQVKLLYRVRTRSAR